MGISARVLGIGTDLVHIPSFSAQLRQPGSVFARVFTTAEAAYAATLAPARADCALAARWAAKEATVKAWSGALFGEPAPLPQIDWAEIEVVRDYFGRPQIALHGRIHSAFSTWFTSAHPGGLTTGVWHASLSHDGDYAMATVLLQEEENVS